MTGAHAAGPEVDAAMAEQRVCAVIPAAGRGTRLGAAVPKIMLEVADGVTVWHLLHRRLRPFTAQVHVVVSPAGRVPFRALVAGEEAVSVSVQEEPRGMGDAIFGCAGHWSGFDPVLVVWGDQVNLSARTVRRVVQAHRDANAGGHGLTVPLVSQPEPYVEYEFDAGSLVRVRQSREGDRCRPGGLSDVGVFCLSTRGLVAAWHGYLAGAENGGATGEVNFLPFLPYLSQELGWPVTVVPVDDPAEASGINTVAELEFARRRLAQSTAAAPPPG